ncbi:MAG TPA: hypothetical protein PKD90_00055 [Phnomibacter sp.]|nr:hypothetical protein [Phnomibacter sp.]
MKKRVDTIGIVSVWVAAVSLLLILLPSCAKEYSYQAGTTVAPWPDTAFGTVSQKIKIPACSRCDSLMATTPFFWQFTLAGSRLCGPVTKGLMSTTRTGFTFFGPSACSPDSGLIIEAFFDPVQFTSNQANLATRASNLFYYDNLTNGFAVRSQLPYTLTLFMDSYQHDSRIGEGRFTGILFNTKGDTASIQHGYFKVPFN